MRPSPVIRLRRPVLLTVTAVAALLGSSSIALAGDDAPDPPGPAARAEDAQDAERAGDTGRDGRRGTQVDPCDDPLVAFSRDAVTGAAHAVALTAQAMDQDTDGWLLLAWEVAEGTHLTQVLATAPDGTTRHLAPTPAGTVDHVAMLTFCGTFTTTDTTTEPTPGDAPAPTDGSADDPADTTADEPTKQAAAGHGNRLPPTAAPRGDGGAADTTGAARNGAATATVRAGGSTGDTGDAGPSGTDGTGAATGNDGANGNHGATGSDGANGNDGDSHRDPGGPAGPEATSGADDGEVEVLGVRWRTSPLAASRAGVADRVDAVGQTGQTGQTDGLVAEEQAGTLALAGNRQPSVAGWALWLLLGTAAAGLAVVGARLRAHVQLVAPTISTSATTTPDGPEAGR